jgi:hypothetical protein
MINRVPKVVSLTTDLHKDLVQVPLPLRTLLHALRSAPSDLMREVSAKSVHPVADRFVANVDPALVKQSSTFRKDSGNRTYIITANWMISDEVLK